MLSLIQMLPMPVDGLSFPSKSILTVSNSFQTLLALTVYDPFIYNVKRQKERNLHVLISNCLMPSSLGPSSLPTGGLVVVKTQG